ncbi:MULTISPECIES: hypothetical protein [Nocardioides]|uniref:Sensor domain-containing protein n=1 Tax=Nocardioides vastitatis TaxID=2568655 RepID=A0ABW0Z9K5_9ACTN|nr:hypothetical protein [Nocardioides sp.]THI95642.1 hypothetical protein E7Z54_18535 [Nocardioides sp.]
MNHRRSTQLLLAAAAVAATSLLAACGSGSSASADAISEGDATTSAPADPSTTSTGGVTAEDLLTDADTVYVEDAADWFAVETWTDAGQQLFGPCAQTGLADTGAPSVEGRAFELRNLDAGAPEVRGDLLTQVVAEYDDQAAATKAWSTVNGWLEECGGRPDAITDYRALQTRKVAVPGADAVITDSHYGPLPKELDDGHSAYIMETGVLRSGSRLTVITSVIVGQDYNFLHSTPVERMLAPAAERLQD